MRMHLVVIGGVAAGLSAASRARKCNRDLKITVYEKGPVISYGACGMPYWVEGQVERQEDLVAYTPEFFNRERNIDVRVNTAVEEIAHSRRRLRLATGEEISYDRLVIATGATPRISDISGTDAPHCFLAHTWTDFTLLEAFLRQRRPSTAVVVGAGFVGLEMAEALQSRGIRVTVVEAAQHPLRWCEQWLTDRIRKRLEEFGVSLLTGYRASAIHERGLDAIPADMVVLATGIRPVTDLAAKAGIRLGRQDAIVVDTHLETNLPGVFAAGDCAETYNRITDSPDWIPLGTTANKMGLIAGANAAGRRERFPGIVGTSIVRVCNLAVATTGLSPTTARQNGFHPVAARVTARSRAKYFQGEKLEVELVADRQSRRLLGAAIVGNSDVESRINTVATALPQGLTVDEFQFTDLCYAPPYAPTWDPVLVAARQLVNRLDEA
jgi:NADPH-dependent 2,4-dienoyl-CoA reductase/sulfur reductase-like enzyme